MKCFITGGSGFIGSNLVHELVAQGHRVKVLLRPGADEHGLLGLKIERVIGDIFDRKLLEREMESCDWCFHVGGSYHLWMRNYTSMYRANVEGTRTVLSAAGKAGCRKIIYTSTAGCIGSAKLFEGKLRPADETEIVTEHELGNDYLRSKFQAEAVAMELYRKLGLPIVVVNPSAVIGAGDLKPTPTGRFVIDYLRGQIPGYLDAGWNWVSIRDVCSGHILAAEKGRAGQRYLLANAQGNWTMQETFSVLEKITGLPAPRRRVPFWLAERIAEAGEMAAFFTRRAPRVSLASVRMARHKMWLDPSKAIRELGLPQTPVEDALADATQWFQANDYLKKTITV